jgi:hypothetical protein
MPHHGSSDPWVDSKMASEWEHALRAFNGAPDLCESIDNFPNVTRFTGIRFLANLETQTNDLGGTSRPRTFWKGALAVRTQPAAR